MRSILSASLRNARLARTAAAIGRSEDRDNPSGIVSPSAAAVFRLTTSSNWVGCSTGRSAAFSSGAGEMGTQFRRSIFGVSPIQLSHHDVRAHARQLERGGTAYATAGSGDYLYLSLQFHMTLLPCRCR